MQKKIGTILDEELLKKAKEVALARHTSLHRIFAEALSEYLSRQFGAKQKLSAVEVSFGAIALSPQMVRNIAREEIYEVE
ncbi:MAG: hypothetical protein Q8N85_05990 [Candidatus Omnitrophota bacterium]|nr:hypothetical protein [Candidatus Omnitrophota bacterium]